MKTAHAGMLGLACFVAACASSESKDGMDAAISDAEGDAIGLTDSRGPDAGASEPDGSSDGGGDGGDAASVGPALQLSAGGATTCALLKGGVVKCWGRNGSGAIGDGTTEIRVVPTQAGGLPEATEVRTSTLHTCAVTKDGPLWCWGENEAGELGYAASDRCGEIPCSVRPRMVSDLGEIARVDVRIGRTCVLLRRGTLKCWGDNHWGGLGDGTRDARRSPVDVKGVSDATQLAMGDSYTCALLKDGTVRCWGLNKGGELGYESVDCVEAIPYAPYRRSMCSLSANRVDGLTDVVEIAAGTGFTCARLASGAVQCWGGPPPGTRYPAISEGAAQITVGGGGCAVMSDKTVKCWGMVTLGDGKDWRYVGPTGVEVPGLTDAVEVSGGGYNHCVRLSGGAVKCWGLNSGGTLGNGTTTDRLTPTLVRW